MPKRWLMIGGTFLAGVGNEAMRNKSEKCSPPPRSRCMRQPKEFYERPLTSEEAQFAADNIYIVSWYLGQRGLDQDEWFDVIIFRYLLAVKRFLSIPALQEYRFVNIACKAMQSAIGGEYAKRERRPVEDSLDESIFPGSNLTYEMVLAAPERRNCF